eukprot:445253_1
MFKLLACVVVGSETIHFYGPYKKCPSLYWYFALIIIMIIIIFWIIITYILYKMNDTERDSRKSSLRSITRPYKLKYWYWESIIISRRFIIAFLITFGYMNYNITQYMLLLVLIIYIVIHFRYFPFKHNKANVMESLCLILILLAMITIIFQLQYIIMSIIVFLPISLFIIYCLLAINHCIKDNKKQQILTNIDVNRTRIQNMKSRLTLSQKQLFELFENHNVNIVEQNNVALAYKLSANQLNENELDDDDNNEINTDIVFTKVGQSDSSSSSSDYEDNNDKWNVEMVHMNTTHYESNDSEVP